MRQRSYAAVGHDDHNNVCICSVVVIVVGHHPPFLLVGIVEK
jgi:hypothetical protein